MTRRHAHGTDSQDGFAAETVDVQDGGDGGDEHDDADYARGEEACFRAAEAKIAEDGGRVVQNRLQRPLESALTASTVRYSH